MVARAKSEPVFFIRAPEPDPKARPTIKAWRQHFDRTDFPWRDLKKLRRLFARRPDLMRQIFLREGYLYSERPNHAFSMVSLLRPRDLFKEQQIWVHRGSWLMHAKREPDGQYTFVDGPEEGTTVKLLHLDRVGTGAPASPALHRDFRGLRYKLFFDRARITHITEKALIAELRYGTYWVESLLSSDGPELELDAEFIAERDRSGVQSARNLMERRARAVNELRKAMRAQIDEALPFDEPKTEVGQQDGSLRRQWRYAYLEGRTRYEFNEDKYRVFDRQGRPHPPQVCVDFLVDTFERASGNWWLPRSAPVRARTPGKLDLTAEFGRDTLRRTKGFLRFAREQTAQFETITFPERERIELGYKPRFFRWLEKRADQFIPGDIVFIRGLTPWDQEDEHTHSFFVYESDPLTGVPIAIAGNAGPANLWSWETEARRTPERTLRDRVRPKLEWLESFLNINPNEKLSPPVLVSGKR
jgi:hypothetical protein